MKVGRQEGLKVGRQEGLKVGRQEEKIEIAKKMISVGIEIRTIKTITGLSEEEIRALM